MAIQSLSRASIANANRKYNTALAGNPLYTDMELISTTLVTTAQPTVVFSSIPQTYKHLQFRITARSSNASTQDNLSFYLNTDTTSNYSTHSLYGVGGSTPLSNSFTTSPAMYWPSQLIANTNTTGAYSAGIIDILDYANTTTNKTLRSLTGYSGSSATISIASGNWRSTAAVNQITFLTSANIMAGSRFSLYGIKG